MYLQIFYLPFMISPWLFSYASALVADIPNLPKRTASSPTSTASASTSSGDATTLGPANRIFLDADTCTEPQQRQIEQAWKDAALLASAAVGGQLNYDYSVPRYEWFGKDNQWPGWFPFSSDYRDLINRDISRAAKLFSDNAARGVYIYMSCPKQHEACTPGTIAGSRDESRFFWKNHYTIFCPPFFRRDSLSVSLSRVANDQNEQEIMDNYWGNQGYSFFHEIYHYGGTVSVPRTEDRCYGAADCWEMAADPHRSTWWAINNADSFSLEAMAIYAQQYFKTERPPVPRKYTVALSPANATLIQAAASAAANPSNSTPPAVPNNVTAPLSLPTQYYKVLDSVPQDLFNSTNGVTITGTNVPSQWKVMVGPPLDASNDLPSTSCVFTTTSILGVTAAHYTLQPTMPTMCLCDSTVIAGYHTVTGSSSTSYLVCEVDNSPTVSTMPPTPATTTQAPKATATPNMSSPACVNCTNDLGATSACAPSDLTCLHNFCSNDTNCQACGIDCSTVGGT